MKSGATGRTRHQLPLGLRARMGGVLKELHRVKKSATADAVHDLRVAIRRCRSFATVMEEVDADRTWRAVKNIPRKLFRALGRLRDLHVLEAWVKRLATPDDPLRSELLSVLDEHQKAPGRKVRKALKAFDQKGWERLAREAPNRARLVPANGLAARCLALERCEELRRLHDRAVRTDTPAPWHALRVGLKRFRYGVEILLPERAIEWDKGLGEIQSLLGMIHDLDVLKERISQEADGFDISSAGSIRRVIAAKRRECMQQYRERMTGENSLLTAWRAGLPHGKEIQAATAARFRTSARAMDPHPGRTAAVTRLAVAVYDGLAASGAGRLQDGKLRATLITAAQLHAIEVDGRRTSRHKAARDFLRTVPVPLGWQSSEWDLLTEVVRYHRGAEPAARHKRFAQLSPERQDLVRGLAGVLRLARGLHRCGVTEAGGVVVDETPANVRLRAPGVHHTANSPARLAKAKHLLERYLGRPVIIERADAGAVHKPRLVFSSWHAHAAGELRRRA